MLILTRKTKEAITIGNVTITIQEIKGNRVKIAIEAPREIPILRGELPTKEAA